MGILDKIIHNDAIKQDPPEIYGWRVFMLAGSVSDDPQDVWRGTLADKNRLASVACFSVWTLVSLAVS
jgi:hypothetical protein